MQKPPHTISDHTLYNYNVSDCHDIKPQVWCTVPPRAELQNESLVAPKAHQAVGLLFFPTVDPRLTP